ncbi:hypothetical protein glysoja_015207 [Glycine soja]|nr:hypothetical protein glysoja_015207 [Glycine soja]
MLGSASAHVTQYLPHIVQVIQDFHFWNSGIAAMMSGFKPQATGEIRCNMNK